MMKEIKNVGEYFMTLRLVSVFEASKLGVKIDVPVLSYSLIGGRRFIYPSRHPMTSIESGDIKPGSIISSAQIQQEGGFKDIVLHLYSKEFFAVNRDGLLTDGFAALVTPIGKYEPIKQRNAEIITDAVEVQEVQAFCTGRCCKRNVFANRDYYQPNINKGFIVGDNLRVICNSYQNEEYIGTKAELKRSVPYAFRIINFQVKLEVPNYGLFKQKRYYYSNETYF